MYRNIMIIIFAVLGIVVALMISFFIGNQLIEVGKLRKQYDRDNLKAYYKSHITDKMFKYELLK